MKNICYYVYGDEFVLNIDCVIEMWIIFFINRVVSIRLYDVGKNKFLEYCGNIDLEVDVWVFWLIMFRVYLNDE